MKNIIAVKFSILAAIALNLLVVSHYSTTYTDYTYTINDLSVINSKQAFASTNKYCTSACNSITNSLELIICLDACASNDTEQDNIFIESQKEIFYSNHSGLSFSFYNILRVMISFLILGLLFFIVIKAKSKIKSMKVKVKCDEESTQFGGIYERLLESS